MALYSISYTRPGESPAIHELEAASDAAARIRFLNLSWVQFTAISINSLALKGDQPEEAKAAALKASKQGKPLPPNYAPVSETRTPRKADLSKSEAAAIRAKAAGLSAVEAAGRALALSSDSVPPRSEQLGPPPKGARALRAEAAGIDFDAQINQLGDDIAAMADAAQRLTREGNHDRADACRAKAKQYAAERLKLTKRKNGK